ncbi:hypothetical protein C2845_PM12G06430 [Panicum miliaceum]|uniref:C3H1-type domain-containing protein n=1 Tax=Panicum miliaceum TaxID=4540 RepID=A0A3L6QDQ5_PANMI|nr:hypothetical protein C2845_PM12G06430 [Panicum miliaceum]
MAVSVKEQQKRRRMAVSSSRTPFDRDFLKFRFKVKPCSVEGCDQDGCSYLHPVEVGRRDPRRFFYDTKPCRDYYRNGGWCPKGDGCKHAHGFLERRFHPSRHWDDEEALEFADLEEHLKEEERLSRHAPERAAIQFILDVKNQIRFYPCDPNRMQQHEAIAPVTTQLSFYDTDDAGYQHDPGASIIDDLSDAFGSDLTLERNDRAICGAPFCQTQKVVPEHIYGIADTTVTKER